MKIYKTVILLKLSFWKTTNVSIFYLIKKWKVKMITWWLFLMASNCNSARNNIENWKKLVNYILLGFFFFFFAKLLVHPLPFLRHQLYTCWFFLIIIIFINEFSCKNLTNFIRKLKEKKILSGSSWVCWISVYLAPILCYISEIQFAQLIKFLIVKYEICNLISVYTKNQIFILTWL